MNRAEPQTIWDRVLVGVVLIVSLYAVGFVVAGLFLGDLVFDRLGFGPDPGDTSGDTQRGYLRLVFGILGAVIVGWMTMVGGIAAGPLRRRERWAWNTIALGVVIWFVLDTGLSLTLGFVGHALFNVAFALVLALPLAKIRAELR